MPLAAGHLEQYTGVSTVTQVRLTHLATAAANLGKAYIVALDIGKAALTVSL